MSKSKKLDPAVKAARAAERKRISDEKKAAKAAAKARAKVMRETNRPYNVFVTRERFKSFGPSLLSEVGKYSGRHMGPTEHVVSLAENQGPIIGSDTKRRNDLFDGREVKHVLGESKSLILFRAGIDSKIFEREALVASHTWLLEQLDAEEAAFRIRYLIAGIKSDWRQSLPFGIVEIYDAHLKPSVALKSYDKGIILTVDTGYLEVRPEEYDAAFQLATWTNGDVKYALNTTWLRALPESLPACKPPLDMVG
jgi:hypothetical protein